MRATGRCPLPADARRRADQVRLSSCRSSSGVIASRLHRSFGAVSDPCARAVCPHQPATRLLQCTKMQPKTRKPSKAEARKQRNRAAAAAARARKQGTAVVASKGAKPGGCQFSGPRSTSHSPSAGCCTGPDSPPPSAHGALDPMVTKAVFTHFCCLLSHRRTVGDLTQVGRGGG